MPAIDRSFSDCRYEGMALDGGLSMTTLRGKVVYTAAGDLIDCTEGQGEWQKSSFLIHNSSFLMHNSPFLIHNSSFFQ